MAVTTTRASLLPPLSVSEPEISPFFNKLSSSSFRVFKFFTVKCPCRQTQTSKKRISLRTTTNVVYTEGPSSSSSSSVSGASSNRKKNTTADSEPDAISVLNERIRRDHGSRMVSKNVMDSVEAEKYIELVKKQQHRDLQRMKGFREGGGGGGESEAAAAFSYKVDPRQLHPGDYVVQKKVGVGRFVAIKHDFPKDYMAPLSMCL